MIRAELNGFTRSDKFSRLFDGDLASDDFSHCYAKLYRYGQVCLLIKLVIKINDLHYSIDGSLGIILVGDRRAKYCCDPILVVKDLAPIILD